ncbi:hypothetical protein ACWC9R_01265 [Streptomyces sp. NPDC001219]
MGIAHIERLVHIRERIAQAGRYDIAHASLLRFSGAGPNSKALAAGEIASIQLIGLARLYG